MSVQGKKFWLHFFMKFSREKMFLTGMLKASESIFIAVCLILLNAHVQFVMRDDRVDTALI